MHFDFSSPHADYVWTVYGLLGVFVLGFGLHALRCYVKARKKTHD